MHVCTHANACLWVYCVGEHIQRWHVCRSQRATLGFVACYTLFFVWDRISLPSHRWGKLAYELLETALSLSPSLHRIPGITELCTPVFSQYVFWDLNLAHQVFMTSVSTHWSISSSPSKYTFLNLSRKLKTFSFLMLCIWCELWMC